MAGEFFPRRDAEFANWAAHLRNRIVLTPQAFGLTPEIVAPFSTLVDELMIAQTRASEPRTRTSISVVARKAARKAVEATARRLVRVIQAHREVTTAQRVALRISVRGRGGRNPRIARPDSAPTVVVEHVKERIVHLRLMAAGATGRRGRAVGAKFALVFWHAGEEPPARLRDWNGPMIAMKTRLLVTVGAHVPPGTKISFAAQWSNPRGERGPYSSAATAYIGGGVSMKQTKTLACAA